MYDVKSGVVLFLDGKYAEAAEHFYNGACEGDAEAAFHYAYMHLKGIGVTADASVAKSYFTFAVTRIGEAAYNLAVMHLHGTGVRRDYRKFVEYMQDAADMGVIEAQLYLAVAYTVGGVYEPDIISISLIPYHTPEFRDPHAYLEGDVPDMAADEELRIRAMRCDPVTAFEYFRMAAYHSPDYVEELSAQGKFLYARCFIDGLGTEFNLARGNDLMLLAAEAGSTDALYYLETQAPYMLDKLKDTEYLSRVRRNERLASAGKK